MVYWGSLSARGFWWEAWPLSWFLTLSFYNSWNILQSSARKELFIIPSLVPLSFCQWGCLWWTLKCLRMEGSSKEAPCCVNLGSLSFTPDLLGVKGVKHQCPTVYLTTLYKGTSMDTWTSQLAWLKRFQLVDVLQVLWGWWPGRLRCSVPLPACLALYISSIWLVCIGSL